MLQKRWWRLVALPAKRSTGRDGFCFFGGFFRGYFCFCHWFFRFFWLFYQCFGKEFSFSPKGAFCLVSVGAEQSHCLRRFHFRCLLLHLPYCFWFSVLGVFVIFMVVFVQLPTELSSFNGRTPESLPKSPSDHMVPTLFVALLLLLLSYTYFNYNFTVVVLSLSL